MKNNLIIKIISFIFLLTCIYAFNFEKVLDENLEKDTIIDEFGNKHIYKDGKQVGYIKNKDNNESKKYS